MTMHLKDSQQCVGCERYHIDGQWLAVVGDEEDVHRLVANRVDLHMQGAAAEGQYTRATRQNRQNCSIRSNDQMSRSSVWQHEGIKEMRGAMRQRMERSQENCR